MAYQLPTLDEMTDILIRDFKNRMPGADVARTSDNWKRVRNFALGATSLHRHLQQIDNDIMPDTATGDRLDRWGAIYDVGRLKATPAQQSNALRVVGTVGAAITLGDVLTDPAGLRYQVNETTTVGAPGYSDVDIIGIDTGLATRLVAGTSLIFTSPGVGINSTATLVLDLVVGGQDVESDGKYRSRILEKIAQPEMGGNVQDFRTWAESYSGAFRVDHAFVWPLRAGLGSVHLAALKDGTGAARLLTAPEIVLLQAWIDDRRPVGYADFLVIAVTVDFQNVDLTVTALDDAAYVYDWNDAAGYSVSGWAPTTRTMTLNVDRPADMAIGDRVIYKRTLATRNNGAEYVIEAFGAGTGDIVLAAKPVQGSTELVTSPPVAGDSVYSGGPLVAPIRTKVLDWMNALGPGRVDSGSGVDWSEGGSYWEGTLRTSKLLALASSVRGIKDAVVLLPVANYAPANVSPAPTCALVAPLQVLVRRG